MGSIFFFILRSIFLGI